MSGNWESYDFNRISSSYGNDFTEVVGFGQIIFLIKVKSLEKEISSFGLGNKYEVADIPWGTTKLYS